MDIRKDVLAGSIVTLLGSAVIGLSLQYDIGALSSLGPGYFPALLGAVVLMTGLGILLPGFRQAPTPFDLAWRGPVMVGAGITSFCGGMQFLGLIPACLLAGFISSLAHPRNSLRDSALISVAVTAVVVVIFVVLLQQPRTLIVGVM